MGDSTKMTIEFLRARLLSERSVSRTAKQRAAQLAKRVMELEEQLRIVTLQRKKAEKAAVEVLAILETRRIGDLSEAIEWDSERDVPGGDNILKENESSTASRTERSEVEDGFSGLEPEISPSQDKNLSWESRNDSPNSYDKQRAKQIKQRQKSFSSTSSLKSSLKHHSGKSCRRILRRETGSATGSETHVPSLPDDNGNGAVAWHNNGDNCSEIPKEASRTEIEETLADPSVSYFGDDQSKETADGPYIHGNGTYNEMERVLEQQAQLIGQFQAEENAQREWEEKYNESKMSTEAYYENGNPSSLADNSSQNEESSEAADRTPLDDEEPRLTGNISNNKPTAKGTSSEKSSRRKEPEVAFSNGFMATDQTYVTSSKARRNETKSSYQEFAFPALERSDTVANGKQSQRLLDDHSNVGSHSNQRLGSNGHGIHEKSAESSFPVNNGSQLPEVGHLESQNHFRGLDVHYNIGSHNNERLGSNGQGICVNSAESSFPVNSCNQLPKDGHMESQNRFRGQLPQVPVSSLGGVLESLQRAKLSLRQELSKVPSPRQGTLAITAPTSSHTGTGTSGGNSDIPTGSARLFRLPFDSFPQAQFSRPKFYSSEFNLSASAHEVGYADSSYGFQNPTFTPNVEPRSRGLLGKDYYDLSSSTSATDSNRYSSNYPELSAERMPSHSELLKSYPDVRNGLPPGDLYMLYGSDRSRSNMRM